MKAEDIAFQLAENAEPQIHCMDTVAQKSFIKPYLEDVEKAMEAHTNATLDKLKEKVKEKIAQAEDGLQNSPNEGKIKYACGWAKQELEDVLQLITEARNE